jgi:peptidoglycan/xylan/chitin deacetylase (PgdA/CDA1 family)
MNQNELTILLYHGVTNSLSVGIENYSSKHIPIEDFEKQIRFLKKNCTILSMNDVVNISKAGDAWPEKAVAVTFDDGFKNNYVTAAPILEKYGCPATFYICAGMINTDLMFWVDKIEDCINRTAKREISILLEKRVILLLDSNVEKISAVTTIKKYCKLSNAETKNRVINELICETGINPSSDACQNYKMMSWAEVRELNSCSLFNFGGHTLYHDVMTAQRMQDLAIDIDTTLNLLNYNLKKITTHFAYPEGQCNHYSDLVINALVDRGVVCCPSAIDGVNTDEDLFNLKRIMPNFMGREFPYELPL